jgi:hypothetical protein
MQPRGDREVPKQLDRTVAPGPTGGDSFLEYQAAIDAGAEPVGCGEAIALDPLAHVRGTGKEFLVAQGPAGFDSLGPRPPCQPEQSVVATGG